MYPSVSPLCFEGCNLLGIIYHIWWECPRIHSFWNAFFALLLRVTGMPVPQKSLLNIPVDFIPNGIQRLIFLILLSAKMTIAESWKRPSVSLAQAKKKISGSCYTKTLQVSSKMLLRSSKSPGEVRTLDTISASFFWNVMYIFWAEVVVFLSFFYTWSVSCFAFFCSFSSLFLFPLAFLSPFWWSWRSESWIIILRALS